jgi:hypothetical protein
MRKTTITLNSGTIITSTNVKLGEQEILIDDSLLYSLDDVANISFEQMSVVPLESVSNSIREGMEYATITSDDHVNKDREID